MYIIVTNGTFQFFLFCQYSYIPILAEMSDHSCCSSYSGCEYRRKGAAFTLTLLIGSVLHVVGSVPEVGDQGVGAAA